MDKSWIGLRNRTTKPYKDGVDAFLMFAFKDKVTVADVIYFPCSKCRNRYYHNLEMVKIHIEMHGFNKSYIVWNRHGENIVSGLNRNSHTSEEGMMMNDATTIEPGLTANMVSLVQEGMGVPPLSNDQASNDEHITNDDDDVDFEEAFEDVMGSNEDVTNFYRRLKDAESDLYENCPKGVTELSFVVELLNLKQVNNMTNKSITQILKFLRKIFPMARIPKSYYLASKLTSDLGFNYVTWDACPNSCMLFRNDDASLENCEICGASRYKSGGASEIGIAGESQGAQGKRVPEKQVRYWPLKPRLQRLFWCSHTAPLMKWHKEERIDDGVMRHPADSLAWKRFDQQYPSFSSESRNIRLGLATDGFNPFGNMSISHSTWPIVVIPYNLPPWLCMKESNFILSVLIDGPKGPLDNIDVYLQPLVEELKELWQDGVSTYDVSTKSFFQLKASLLWTISDFPAYANISGWSTKAEFACPICNKDNQATRLTHSRKFCYWGHRRFLPPRHRFRNQKPAFDGKVDTRPPPPKLTGSQLLKQLNDHAIETVYKKEDVFKKRKREQREKELAKQSSQPPKKIHNWKKKSIFWELPYWENNVIRHNLDVMHVEKNVCDNVLFTILGIKKRTKDNVYSRRDLKELNIRHELHPHPRGANIDYLPPAEYTMTNREKEIFLKVLRDVRVPDGYSSNISRCVHLDERTIRGLKSHDNHILLQQLLPIAARRALPKHIVQALIELSNCFAILCSSVNTLSDLEKFEDRMALTLCSLEKIFPPSFFDVMEHLPIHLADELHLAGAVIYRWMYPIERYLHTLKLYMRNRARPEASIAKNVLLHECMTFCTRYVDDSVETKSNRPARNDDRGEQHGRGLGKKVDVELDDTTFTQAHRYVLGNVEALTPFIEKHIAELTIMYPHNSQKHLVNRKHNEEFHIWLRNHVNQTINDDEITDEIRSIALGPRKNAYRYKSYIISGFRFRTKKLDLSRKTQNSGVFLKATQMSYSSSRDSNPRSGDIVYYGVLTDILELHYLNGLKFVLFKCDWVNPRVGKMVDEFKFTLVNFNHLLYKENRLGDEPFILASQAEQVFYVEDPIEPDWHVVARMTPRDRFDKYSIVEEDLEVSQVEPFNRQQLEQNHTTSWARQGVDGVLIDTTIPDDDDVEGDEMEDN